MIEIIDLKKHYKSKKGPDQQALNGINLTLEDKGFVVILGRSGSGKSTLLNILGGLDKFDSGEIIIKGKSTKDFKGSEWDAYRNTYVGFIFQEFHIIDEFTLGKNIALTLELQGYKSNLINGRVREILKSVELEGYEDRRTNEISGGEEQRIAIARALVKNPEILLVDEPTGNLDSGTGKVILDTLKEISKEKLVVMVTHDIEFANMYGDRIIELEDGEIINDTRNNNVIESEIIEKKSSNNLELRKSSLNFGSTLKLSLSSLFTKKIRLILMMFLFVLSLLFVGISSNLAFRNNAKAAYLTLNNAGVDKITLVKQEERCIKRNCRMIDTSSTNTDFETLNDRYSDINFLKVREEVIPFISEYDQSKLNENIYIKYLEVTRFITGVIISDNLNENEFNVLHGSNSVDKNEVIITDFLAQSLINHKIFGDITYSKLIGKTININETELTIVGIVDTDFEKYDDQKSYTDDFRLERSGFLFDITVNYATITISSETLDEMDNKIVVLEKDIDFIINNEYVFHATGFTKASLLNQELLLGSSDLPNSEDEIVIPLSEFASIINVINEYDLTNEEVITNFDEYFEFLKEKEILFTYEKYNYVSDQIVKEDYKIVGVYDDSMIGERLLIVTDNKYEQIYLNNYFFTTLATFGNDDKENIKLLGDLDDLGYKSLSEFSETMDSLKEVTTKSKSIFYVTAAVFAFFTSILILSIISSSITAKKKEIGTLRAIGASGIDVAKIFILEGLIIAVIAASISSFLMNNVINSVNVKFNDFYLDDLGINFSSELVILYLDITSILSIFVLALFVTILASFIPVMRIALMKPIDAIKNK